jgi:hypothetical protein
VRVSPKCSSNIPAIMETDCWQASDYLLSGPLWQYIGWVEDSDFPSETQPLFNNYYDCNSIGIGVRISSIS